jgi:hypothetical protein
MGSRESIKETSVAGTYDLITLEIRISLEVRDILVWQGEVR